MATDVTTELLQMIRSAFPAQAENWSQMNSIISGSSDTLSTIANWAQVLGTAAPAVQKAAGALIGDIASGIVTATGGSEQEATALSNTIATDATGTVLGGALVLTISVFIGILEAMGSSANQSQQAQEWTMIQQTMGTAIEVALAGYWLEKIGILTLQWTTIEGYLNDLVCQGTSGNYVKQDADGSPGYHSAAQDFIILLTGVSFGSGGFWAVLSEPNGQPPQSTPLAGSDGFYAPWYGNFPARDVADTDTGAVGASDPVTMLPVLALGLQAYMLLQSVAYTVDPTTQTPFQQFVSQYGPPELQGYLNFLYESYQLAVNGIVKTELPTEDEILGALWHFAFEEKVMAHPSTNVTQSPSKSWGAPWPTPSSQPSAYYSGNGYAWSFWYGAAATYPRYGDYGNPQVDSSGLNVFSPAYICSTFNPAAMVSQWWEAEVLFKEGSETYISIEALANWTVPWLQNKIILGNMARWKAIYLFNGFDGAWSVALYFQKAASLNGVPAQMNITQDNTIASGNWYARELCEVVLPKGTLLTGNAYSSEDNGFTIFSTDPTGKPLTGRSVGGLLDFLYNVANGNWAGPPPRVTGAGQSPPRPLSFRDLLAAAAE